MAGISSRAAGKLTNKNKFGGKELQSAEFSDGSGIEEYDFHYRFYDMQLGVFHNQDRLADKFAYMSPYQFCSNNPIWLRELDGLEGVKYTEVDKDGNKRTIIEKNVVVLTEKTKIIPTDATQKEIKKITRLNGRIERNNDDRVAAVKNELNENYNGSTGKGAKNSNGDNIYFKFNVSGVEVKNTNGGSVDDLVQMGNDYGITSSEKDGNGDFKIAPAAIVTSRGSGSALGQSDGVWIGMNENSPYGTITHEIGHTFLLKDNYIFGGVMASPGGAIISTEVDKSLEKSFKK